MEQKKVLLIEDEDNMEAIVRMGLASLLENGRIGFFRASSVKEGILSIERHNPSVILLDIGLGEETGMDVLEYLAGRQTEPRVVVPRTVVITGFDNIETGAQALRLGAWDFITKPIELTKIYELVEDALDPKSISKNVYLSNHRGEHNQCNILGISPDIREICRIIEHVAQSKAPVLVTGESGTGKELCAQAIHNLAGRNAPFVAVNCAAIPNELIESELFGHVRGAFTGAVSDKKGAVARADGGVLFLDEVGETPQRLQASLLRFLQLGTYWRVGGEKEEKANIRLVCATNRNLRDEIKKGRFREDLFYRINTIPLELPPLRERGDTDILLLARAFLLELSRLEKKGYTDFSEKAKDILVQYSWPGNVRELKNMIHRMVLMGGTHQKTVGVKMIPLLKNNEGEVFKPNLSPKVYGRGKKPRLMADIERDAIIHAVRYCKGNIASAAKHLEVGHNTLLNKIYSWQGTDKEFNPWKEFGLPLPPRMMKN